MSAPTKLTIYDFKEKEVAVTLDANSEEKEVYINLDGKELLLPANWALALANVITITAQKAIDGEGK